MRKNAYLLFLIFIFIFSYNKYSNAQSFDYQALKDIEKWRSPSDTRFNHFISDGAGYVSVGTPLVMFGIGLLNHDADLRKKGFDIGLAVGVTIVETYALKYAISRPRPYITHPDLSPLGHENSFSFPSGHSSAAFSFATSLSMNYRHWYVAVPAFAWATATAYSRLYLGVHYPTDVLTGAVLGVGTAWITHKVNKKWQQKKETLKKF